jgi:hypothetical protein
MTYSRTSFQQIFQRIFCCFCVIFYIRDSIGRCIMHPGHGINTVQCIFLQLLDVTIPVLRIFVQYALKKPSVRTGNRTQSQIFRPPNGFYLFIKHTVNRMRRTLANYVLFLIQQISIINFTHSCLSKVVSKRGNILRTMPRVTADIATGDTDSGLKLFLRNCIILTP